MMSTETLAASPAPPDSASHAAALTVRGLRAGYGAKMILEHVDLDVARGEISLLVGHNGAGKSTILKGIMGLLHKAEGEVVLDGKSLGRPDVRRNVAAGINIVLQQHSFFPNLNVAENLDLGAYSLNLAATALRERVDRIYGIFPRLAERRTSVARLLSGGEQKMLSIGIALMTHPRLLLIDEPSAGLAPKLVEGVMDQLRDLNQRWGTTILLVEQNVRAGLGIADSVLVVRLGTIAGHYNAADLRRQDNISTLF